jgi:hypothetical protein
VFFNSNEYLGYFDSMDPVNSNGISSTLNQAIVTLPHRDIDQAVVAAEDALLRSLVAHYPESSKSLQQVLEARSFTSQDIEIEWSHPHRKWLFTRLVEDNVMPQENDTYIAGAEALRACLSSRDDVPPGAFSRATMVPPDGNDGENKSARVRNSVAGELMMGSLCTYFSANPDPQDDASSSDERLHFDEKHALATQEHFMALLAANAAQRVSTIQNNLKSLAMMMEERSVLSHLPEEQQATPQNLTLQGQGLPAAPNLGFKSHHHNCGPFQNLTLDEMTARYSDLLAALPVAIEKRNHVDNSLDQVRRRLIRVTTSNSEGKKSAAIVRKKLAIELEKHLEHLEAVAVERADEMGASKYNDLLGKVDGNGESIKFELAEIDRNWGEWCYDDYVWSPEKANGQKSLGSFRQVDLLSLNDDDESNESLEDGLDRIDSEWSQWAD